MRERIIESAVKGIKEFGMRRFTMDDIAADLKISKKTLYQHFSSKKELVRKTVDWALELEKKETEAALAATEDWLEKLNSVLKVHVYTNLPYSRLDEINRYFPDLSNSMDSIMKYKADILTELLMEGIKEGRVRRDIDQQIVILAIEKVFFTPTKEEFLRENDLTVNQLLNQLKEIILDGILKHPYLHRAD